MAKAYFAGGCFWCITPAFSDICGVISVTSGYCGGDETNPTYEEVKHGKTHHRETVCVEYTAPAAYETLLDAFLRAIDPFDGDGQFIDRGDSYKTAIFYENEAEKEAAKQALVLFETDFGRKCCVDLLPFKTFWPTEEYHQNYGTKNPEAFDRELIESGRKAPDLAGAKWIWINDEPQSDEYGEFVSSFTCGGGKTFLYISADSNYEAYINGNPVSVGQYADYPHDKVYDRIDLSDYIVPGENRLCVRVWYYGITNSFTYCKGRAAVIFRVSDGEKTLCVSDETTLARISPSYRSHENKIITGQLGLTYSFDATKKDGWLYGDVPGFSPAVIVRQTLPLRVRPCRRPVIQSRATAKELPSPAENVRLFDLGREEVGFFALKAASPEKQTLTVSWGEHLVEGRVPRKIGGRDFSLTVTVGKGETNFVNRMRRLGCRYIEITAERPLDALSAAIYPVEIECKSLPRPKLTEVQKRIYDVCVRTLKLCMHEHYEDCPWREQSLYGMDSRNQMLCGYKAFGEYEFPRANLQLMSRDRRGDELLSICFPISNPLTIPSFGLHYITAVKEYTEHSGDESLLQEVYPKLTRLISAFTSRLEDGLCPIFPGKDYWNFYEWAKDLNGEDGAGSPDLILNALLSIALKNMDALSRRLGRESTYLPLAEKIDSAIREKFLKDGMFHDRADKAQASELGISLAILCRAATDAEAAILAEKLTSVHSFTPATLSMRAFKYDALLKVNREKYISYILTDIEKHYIPMLDGGTGTVWETDLGWQDFSNAGSLCHGWSAIPIYYYHELLA